MKKASPSLYTRQFITVLAAMLIAGCSTSHPDTVWPSDTWPVSTPETD